MWMDASLREMKTDFLLKRIKAEKDLKPMNIRETGSVKDNAGTHAFIVDWEIKFDEKNFNV